MLAGAGLHTGRHVRMALRPAGPDTGIVFLRKDLPDHGPDNKNGANRIAACAENIADARLGTTLRNEAGAEAATVEHLLAAFAGMGADNVVVELDGPEPPAVDGSAAPFVELLNRAGLRRQGAPRAAIRVLRDVVVEMDGRRAVLSPAPALSLDIGVEYSAPIGRQSVRFDASSGDFAAELAPARTFGFRADLDRLRAGARALGATLDNTVAIHEGAVENPEGLRFPDEFARHKALDALGDLALAGAPIMGCYRAERPGHALNLATVRALLADSSAWRRETAAPSIAAPRAG